MKRYVFLIVSIVVLSGCISQQSKNSIISEYLHKAADVKSYSINISTWLYTESVHPETGILNSYFRLNEKTSIKRVNSTELIKTESTLLDLRRGYFELKSIDLKNNSDYYECLDIDKIYCSNLQETKGFKADSLSIVSENIVKLEKEGYIMFSNNTQEVVIDDRKAIEINGTVDIEKIRNGKIFGIDLDSLTGGKGKELNITKMELKLAFDKSAGLPLLMSLEIFISVDDDLAKLIKREQADNPDFRVPDMIKLIMSIEAYDLEIGDSPDSFSKYQKVVF